jgi:hypothetical protein
VQFGKACGYHTREGQSSTIDPGDWSGTAVRVADAAASDGDAWRFAAGSETLDILLGPTEAARSYSFHIRYRTVHGGSFAGVPVYRNADLIPIGNLRVSADYLIARIPVVFEDGYPTPVTLKFGANAILHPGYEYFIDWVALVSSDGCCLAAIDGNDTEQGAGLPMPFFTERWSPQKVIGFASNCIEPTTHPFLPPLGHHWSMLVAFGDCYPLVPQPDGVSGTICNPYWGAWLLGDLSPNQVRVLHTYQITPIPTSRGWSALWQMVFEGTVPGTAPYACDLGGAQIVLSPVAWLHRLVPNFGAPFITRNVADFDYQPAAMTLEAFER